MDQTVVYHSRRERACNVVTNRPYSGRNVVLLFMAANAGYQTPHRDQNVWERNCRQADSTARHYFSKNAVPE